MLKKELGAVGVFSIAAGAMISSGLFILPGLAFAKAGPAVIIAYFFAGVMMIPSLLAKVELATAMPKSGGSYFFVERSLGPLMGTIAGFANWLSIALKATFAMVGIGALSRVFFPDSSELTIKLIAAAACIFFGVVNIVTVKGAGRIQILLVFALIAILILYVVKGFGVIDSTRYSPFVAHGMQSVFAVAGMVFISFGGLTKVVDVAEEVHNGKRNLPLGMFSAFIVVNLLYMLVVFVTVGIVEPGQLAGSLMPISLGGEVAMGKVGGVLISVAAFLAFATTGNAGMLSSSRTPMAMSADGLLPSFLARTSKKFHTPHFSLAITCSFMLIVIMTLSIENLVKTASTIMILMFILMNTAVVIMRHSGIQSYRPTFKMPFNPVMPVITIIIYLFLIFEMGRVPLMMTGGFAIIALIWYLAYVQRKIDRQSAVVYLVKSIVSTHIERTGLEEELKLIALERDQITPDRFDKLIKHCGIIDISEAITAQEFFDRAAETLSASVGIEKERLYELFIQRERESTTVIKPGLAIPHIVIEGKNVFEILLVRCKGGILFSELNEPVRTAFVLIGSPDERNYHLRALMSIAYIVSEEDFERRWFDARNAEQLRDIVLLSSRKRDKQL